MTSRHRELGNRAEEAASRYLEGGGYRLLDRNWRKPWGELDIIADKGGIIHFIEVKAQAVSAPGFEAHIRAGRPKLEKVVRTARSWLAAHCSVRIPPWQIDVIEVTIPPGASHAHIRHFRNILA